MTSKLPRSTHQFCLAIIVLILVLVPFHATLTVWLSSIVGHYTALRLWKEALLLVLSTAIVWLVIRDKTLRLRLRENHFYRTTFYLAGTYVVLSIMLGGLALLRHDVTAKALGYGLISNLRFLLFFVLCLVIGTYFGPWLKHNWQKVVLWPAVLVIGFGLLQLFVLPVDFLKHLGYNTGTITPYIAVDQKVEYARVQSTLRGPNPLGAYLVLIVPVLVGLFVGRRSRYVRIGVMLLGAVIVLFGTYSRSAWIGTIIATLIVIWALIRSVRLRKILLISSVSLCIIGAGITYGLRNNDFVQNTLFHTDETSQSASSSNEDRANAITEGIKDIVHQPFGKGTGTAGPASVYNNNNVRIAENYFIQIGQEVGVIGLGLFVAICAVVGNQLWRVKNGDMLALALFASLIGLSAVNLLSHAWADDTISYLWWGLAGLTIGSTVIKAKSRT